MSPIAQWQQDLAKLEKLGRFQPFKLSNTTDRTLQADELSAALQEIGPVTGWLMTTGAVHELHDDPLPTDTWPLAGEWFHGDQHWQLEHQYGRQWQLIHRQLQATEAEQATHLGVYKQQRKTGGGRLNYWVLWQANDDTGPQQTQALLTSIETNEA